MHTDVAMKNEMTQAELEKIHAEIAKLIAETAKINTERFWYPMVVVSGIFATAFRHIKIY